MRIYYWFVLSIQIYYLFSFIIYFSLWTNGFISLSLPLSLWHWHINGDLAHQVPLWQQTWRHLCVSRLTAVVGSWCRLYCMFSECPAHFNNDCAPMRNTRANTMLMKKLRQRLPHSQPVNISLPPVKCTGDSRVNCIKYHINTAYLVPPKVSLLLRHRNSSVTPVLFPIWSRLVLLLASVVASRNRTFHFQLCCAS